MHKVSVWRPGSGCPARPLEPAGTLELQVAPLWGAATSSPLPLPAANTEMMGLHGGEVWPLTESDFLPISFTYTPCLCLLAEASPNGWKKRDPRAQHLLGIWWANFFNICTFVWNSFSVNTQTGWNHPESFSPFLHPSEESVFLKQCCQHTYVCKWRACCHSKHEMLADHCQFSIHCFKRFLFL